MKRARLTASKRRELKALVAAGKIAVAAIPPSAAEIEAAKTPAGGWTRETLARWGVAWPPRPGWKAGLERAHEAARMAGRIKAPMG